MSTITTKAPKKDNRTISVDYDFGASLQDAVNRFGEAVVFSFFEDNATIALQQRIRAWMEADLSDADINAKVAEWKPGVKSPRTGGKKKDPATLLKEAFASMSAEEKQAMLRDLKASLQTA
jgi:hypothetical protein